MSAFEGRTFRYAGGNPFFVIPTRPHPLKDAMVGNGPINGYRLMPIAQIINRHMKQREQARNRRGDSCEALQVGFVALHALLEFLNLAFVPVADDPAHIGFQFGKVRKDLPLKVGNGESVSTGTHKG
jgi:hypothetical protein